MLQRTVNTQWNHDGTCGAVCLKDSGHHSGSSSGAHRLGNTVRAAVPLFGQGAVSEQGAASIETPKFFALSVELVPRAASCSK